MPPWAFKFLVAFAVVVLSSIGTLTYSVFSFWGEYNRKEQADADVNIVVGQLQERVRVLELQVARLGGFDGHGSR